MLKLKNIVKDYQLDSETVSALKGISLEFGSSEFVSILGPSGCGKTTLLNIVGGLDQYTSGDLIIDGRSTKDYDDADWDSYRNHSIGFVFQSYNLIPHQTVLRNVELALTISGVSKAERHRRAAEALEKVGLGDQLRKKPNQLSGGQMQRVAIARALVNNPRILLADEPTGALDSETSVQIMELLKEIASDRLVIMVTHNPDLAEQYSTRIVRLLDGKIISDSNPRTSQDAAAEPRKKTRKERRKEKTSMSFFTALALSLNNLMTKKTRTILTAFAGSIGIIGIALILSLSSGFQNYIHRVEEDTLSSYPITIQKETMDMTGLMTTIMGVAGEGSEHDLDKIYSSDIMGQLINAMLSEVQSNDLAAFKEYLESGDVDVESLLNGIQYAYDVELNIFKSDTSDGIVQVNPSTVMQQMTGMGNMMDQMEQMGGGMASSFAQYSPVNVWDELLGNSALLNEQYDVLAGKWPEAYNEVVLIVDENNEVSDLTLYTLGMRDQSELSQIMKDIMQGKEVKREQVSYYYDEILALRFKLVLAADMYEKNETSGAWIDKREDEEFMKQQIDSGLELKVVGIIRPADGTTATAQSGAIGYTSALTQYVINETNEREIVKQQLADDTVDIFTGLPFSNGEKPVTPEFDINMLTPEQKAYFESLTPEEQQALIEMYTKPTSSEATYDANILALGIADLDSPSMMNLYPADFEAKEKLIDILNEYNKKHTDEGNEELVINYTDYVGLIMSSVSTIIDTISYVLIAFVAISLVVSSIMIGIITYISVLERTREIGILRSIGASKHDISRVFNAETVIVGFVSGVLGIVVTLLLCIPANAIVRSLTEIPNVAQLPVGGGIILVAISVVLTLVAGLIPARIAAKKDPVTALRTE